MPRQHSAWLEDIIIWHSRCLPSAPITQTQCHSTAFQDHFYLNWNQCPFRVQMKWLVKAVSFHPTQSVPFLWQNRTSNLILGVKGSPLIQYKHKISEHIQEFLQIGSNVAFDVRWTKQLETYLLKAEPWSSSCCVARNTPLEAETQITEQPGSLCSTESIKAEKRPLLLTTPTECSRTSSLPLNAKHHSFFIIKPPPSEINNTFCTHNFLKQKI